MGTWLVVRASAGEANERLGLTLAPLLGEAWPLDSDGCSRGTAVLETAISVGNNRG